METTTKPTQLTIECMTCHRPLPEGREHPEYFGQVSDGWGPEHQTQRAAEDVDQLLRYLQTVNSAMWDMFMVADIKLPEFWEKEHYIESASKLGDLLTALADEASRKIRTLAMLAFEQKIACKKEPAKKKAA